MHLEESLKQFLWVFITEQINKLWDALYVQKFNGKDFEDILLFYLRIVAVLEGRGNHDAVTEDSLMKRDSSVQTRYAEKACIVRAVIVRALGDEPLRALQKAKTQK